MIWPITENLGVRPPAQKAPIFSIDIQEEIDINADASLIARHLLEMPDGSVWEITTRRADQGYTTICGVMEGPEMFRTTADTKDSAMFNHFDVMTGLIAPTSETNPLV